MHPLSRVTTSGILRAGDLSSRPEAKELLRVGRVLLGQVTQGGAESRLELAIGRQRLALQTGLLLKPGEQYLLRVENQNGELILRMLGGDQSAPTPILDALRQVLGEARPVAELLRDLAARLNAETQNPGGKLEALKDLLQLISKQVFPAEGGADELHSLLRNSGLRYEAALAETVIQGATPERLNLLRTNLKARLLAAVAEFETGAVHKALLTTLAGLEAEQVLNVARQAAGEPLIWSFPFPDLEGWTTARLALRERARHEDDEASQSEEGEETTRLTLGISFSRLGPIRAEFSLEPKVISVRILVTNEELADRIRGDFEHLTKRLGDGQRSLQLSTAVRSVEEVERNTKPGEVSFLQGKHLLDLEG